MAYKDDDMTYAVVKYAEEHPEKKLTWTAIVDWIHEVGSDEDFRLAGLAGIREYQFRRPVTRNGKKTYRECKKRFDEINQLREEMKQTKLPNLFRMNPGKFVSLPYSEQITAIQDMQDLYQELQKEKGIALQKVRSCQQDIKYVTELGERVSELEENVQKTVKRVNDQVAHIIRLLNDIEVISLLKEYQIPMDTLDHVKIQDFLEKDLTRIHDIGGEINAYLKTKNTEKGETAAVEQDSEVQYWNRKNAELFEDDDE